MSKQKNDRPMYREKYSDKKLDLPPLAGFDFETEGLAGAFIAGAICTSDNDRVLFTDLHSLFEWMVAHPQYRYLAHNACGYEFAYLADLVYSFFSSSPGVELLPTYQGDTRLISLRIVIPIEGEFKRSGKPVTKTIDMRDTLCLWPMSLANVAKSFCPEIPKLKENINFERETFDPNNARHVEYVFRDCDIVVLAYQRHAANIRDVFNSPLGLTAGSTALKAFLACIEPGKAYYRAKKSEKFIRKAYYGGLVLPGHAVGEWGKIGCIDVNAAYGYQMREHEFPVGTPYATWRFHPDKIGFYQVIATVSPEVFETIGFNPVPRKDKEGLCWPTGVFETYLSSPEILYAESVGCTFEILCGYVFPRTEQVFKDFIDRCEKMEKFEKGRYKQSIKPVRNSLYGKFGTKETHNTLVFSKETIIGAKPVIDPLNGHIHADMYLVEQQQDAAYIMPHWAALITAYERLYLMRFIEMAYRLGAKNVYTDTDSLKFDIEVLDTMLKQQVIPTGNSYGEFKLEETCSSFKLVGGKCFYGVVEDGKNLVKAKGVPERVLTIRNEDGIITGYREDIYDQAIKNVYNHKTNDIREELEFSSVKSVVSIFKERSHVRPIRRKRRITDIKNSHAWQTDRNGKIYPRGYREWKDCPPVTPEREGMEKSEAGGQGTFPSGMATG